MDVMPKFAPRYVVVFDETPTKLDVKNRIFLSHYEAYKWAKSISPTRHAKVCRIETEVAAEDLDVV